MARVHRRLDQEVHRLGGDYAHVLDETTDSKRDDRTCEVWLHGRITYLLLRRSGRPAPARPGSPDGSPVTSAPG
jgi:hypothetical protein